MTADYSLVVSAYGSTFFALGFVRLGRFDKAMTVEAGRFKLLPMKFCQGPSSVGGN